jgi:hypothetical protein
VRLVLPNRLESRGPAVAGSGDELYLKLTMAALFLPDGLSFFIGDFRLSAVRVMLIVLIVAATSRFLQRRNSGQVALVPSDLAALATGVWMILATAVTNGVSAGFKGGTAAALEFTGAYFVFRYLLGPVDSSVRLIRFSSTLIIFIVALALLDTLTNTLYTYELVKRLTGFANPIIDECLASGADAVYRNGAIRAQGPLEHSILFAAVCAWFTTLSLCMFPARLFSFSKCVAGAAFIGVLISQARGPLVAYVVGVGLVIFNSVMKQFTARWRVLGSLVALYLVAVFAFSSNPIATLLRFAGVDPSAAWYREVIWTTAGPLVLGSPVFGTGGDWDWQANELLVGGTVDALWLANGLLYGIPGTVLMFLTMVGAFWLGPVDESPYLSREERRLSSALGIVIAITIFLGFTVHLYGACAILIGIFPAIRANLAEAAVVRARAARYGPLRYRGSAVALDRSAQRL